MNNQKLCTIIMLTYHVLFSGSVYTLGKGYVEEIKELREEIRYQSRRVTETVTNVQQYIEDTGKACKKFGRYL